MINYCLPLTLPSQEEILRAIDENISHYQYFEIWLDYIQDLDDSFIDQLCSMYGSSLLFLFRRKQLEPIQMPFERRVFFMQELAETGSFLDLDYLTQREELLALKEIKGKVRCILSYHNYQLTPDDRELKLVLDQMLSFQPDVVKLCTFCTTPSDATRLLQLSLYLKGLGKEYIVLGMGPHGVATRILGTLWGNKMIFAPHKSSDASAPGQLTLAQLQEIFEVLQTGK